MEWNLGTLNVDAEVVMPTDKQYKEKYLVGMKLLLLHKNTLIQSGDHNYSTFLELYQRVVQSTMLDFDRAHFLFQAVKATRHLEGCTAECGVYKGGGSVLIHCISPERKHYAMDTFEGFPDLISDLDVHEKGHFSDVSIENIKKMFDDYNNIVMLKGEFSESFEKIQHEVFSFVYIDADLYLSTLQCCDFFYPRLLKGGIMLLDDYLIPDTPGVKKAVDEFFAEKDEFPIVLPTCQAMVFKA